MAATALDRQRACRAGLRAGAIQVTVTVNEMDLTSKLIERGLAFALGACRARATAAVWCRATDAARMKH